MKTLILLYFIICIKIVSINGNNLYQLKIFFMEYVDYKRDNNDKVIIEDYYNMIIKIAQFSKTIKDEVTKKLVATYKSTSSNANGRSIVEYEPEDNINIYKFYFPVLDVNNKFVFKGRGTNNRPFVMYDIVKSCENDQTGSPTITVFKMKVKYFLCPKMSNFFFDNVENDLGSGFGKKMTHDGVNIKSIGEFKLKLNVQKKFDFFINSFEQYLIDSNGICEV